MCDCRGMFCEEIVWAGHLLVMFTLWRGQSTYFQELQAGSNVLGKFSHAILVYVYTVDCCDQRTVTVEVM